MPKAQKRIHKVIIKYIADDSPDTSWLGEYANKTTSEFSIDRAHAEDCPINSRDLLPNEIEDGEDPCNCGECGDMQRNEYRYFNPSFNYVDKQGHALPENTPEEIRRYVKQDYERMEALHRGEWGYIGIRADAKITMQDGLMQRITSGGIYSYESDMSKADFEEAEEEQLAELRGQLKAIGFSSRAISQAFKDVQKEYE